MNIQIDILILLLFTLVCALSDLKTHKIPNRLILCGLIWALLSRISLIRLEGGWGLLDGAFGFLIPCLILGPLAFLKMIGGADVKLLAVIGLQLGTKGSINMICASFLYGALWSAVIVIRKRNLFLRFQILYRYLIQVIAAGKVISYRTDHSDPSGEFCFALPILAALYTMILLSYL